MKRFLWIMVMVLWWGTVQATECKGPVSTWNNCLGVEELQNGKYVGEYQNGSFKQGTFVYTKGHMWEGNMYTGQFKDNKFHGQGRFKWASGDIYVGEFKDGKKHGQGTYTFADGKIDNGIWEDGKLIEQQSLSSNAKEIFGIKLDDNLNNYKILSLDEKQKIAGIDAPIKNRDFGSYTVFFSKNKKIFMIVGHLKENFISQSKCMGALKKYFKVLNSKLELDLYLDDKTEKPNQIIHFYGPNMGLLFKGSTASTIQCNLRDKNYYGAISLWNTLSQIVDKESDIDTSGLVGNGIKWNEIHKDIYLKCLTKTETNVFSDGTKNRKAVPDNVGETFLKITKDKKKMIFISSEWQKENKHVYEVRKISKNNGFLMEATMNKESKNYQDTMFFLLLHNEPINEDIYIGKADFDWVSFDFMGYIDKHVVTSECKITYSKLF